MAPERSVSSPEAFEHQIQLPAVDATTAAVLRLQAPSGTPATRAYFNLKNDDRVLSAIDLGQGMKQVTRQICAETIGVPVDDVYVDTADSDTGPHDMGSFASRGTHRVGNAVITAAKEARSVMMEAAAEVTRLIAEHVQRS